MWMPKRVPCIYPFTMRSITGYISSTKAASRVFRKYRYTQLIKSRAASAVLYMGSFPPSGNRFGIRPSRSFTAKVRRMLFAVSYLPVLRQMPGRAIMVSLPQSSKKG